ncbi:MAG: class I adenylate-forming enzyme family protein [Alphaproteobacteria bacterium]|jgi:acyl-CoA synthetase (AMP-forming)/AMP-acid ligase II|nr:class I adenylate-forming enzyme family protein [Alphaproteobacteria bacterium]
MYNDNVGYVGAELALSHPKKTAVIDVIDGRVRERGHGELQDRLDRVAAMLRALDLKAGDRFAVCVGNRIEYVEIVIGAMRMGAVPVPINTRLGADTIRFILEDAAAVAALVEPAACPAALDEVEALGIAPRICVAGERGGWLDYETLLAAAAAFDGPAAGGEAILMQPYTSGSTGRPKGVPLTHAGQIWNLEACGRHFDRLFEPGARALTANPLYHKNAFSGVVKPMLRVGGSMVVLNQFEPRAFIQALADFRCSYTISVPTVFALLLEHRELIASSDLSALRALLVGSAPCPPRLLEDVQETFGVPIFQGYGLTEAGPIAMGGRMSGPQPPHGSAGTLVDGCEAKMLDEDGREADDFGELWLRSPGVTPGYHNLAEVNAERLRDGWLRTGDLFHRDAVGLFHFRGRTDDMFQCGAENVYPIEVENLLLRHADVVNVCVVPIPHPTKGEVPVAMVVTTEGAATDGEGLKQFCLDHGPAFSHPRRIAVVDTLPLTGVGKIDRRAIQRQFAEG